GRLDPQAALHIMWQLLDSLSDAHHHGLLHRDIKPANVRVFEYMGDPLYAKLLDFGLARDVDGGPQVTAKGELVGTPRYMAPEQLTEKPLSPATDIYSLGMVALEMLIGRDALGGNQWAGQLDRLRPEHTFDISAADTERIGAGLVAV